MDKRLGKVCMRCGVKLESDWGFPTYCMDCLRSGNEAKRSKKATSDVHLFGGCLQENRSVERKGNEVNSNEKSKAD